MRRAGVQFYARKGVLLFIIQFLGRCGSAAVEQYVGNAFIDVAAKASIGKSLSLLSKPGVQELALKPALACRTSGAVGDQSERSVCETAPAGTTLNPKRVCEQSLSNCLSPPRRM